MQAQFKPVLLDGSFRKTLVGNRTCIAGDTPLSVTVYMAKSAGEEQYTALEEFATAHQLTVSSHDNVLTAVKLSGSSADMQAAFNVCLDHTIDLKTGRQIRTRSGPISVPENLAEHITAVLGLDTRPVARPHCRILSRTVDPSAKARALSTNDVIGAFTLGSDADGTGVCAAILELGGGYQQSDITACSQKLGIKEPVIEAVSVDGAVNSPGDPNGADGEVALDIQVLTGIANGAKIAVYFCPNTDQGFVDGILAVANDKERKPQVLSISWGGPEDSWSGQAIKAMNQALEACAVAGVSVFVSSGDEGSQDGESVGLHVDFPGSSPYVTSCGGTKLIINSNESISSQVVWDEANLQEGSTGGGRSALFPMPDYQKNVKSLAARKMRGVPDVAGPADPETGYEIIVDGQWSVIGGTSSCSPLWAGIIARAIQKRGGRSLGLVNPVLYNAPASTWYDIRSGNNDYTDNAGYSAEKGWDACTGLGTPIGKRLEPILLAA